MTFAFGLGAFAAHMRRFGREKRGAIAILFALAVLPVMFLIGMAIDFRTMQTGRADMQNALDSGLLAAARVYAANGSLDQTQREAVSSLAGDAMFQANLADSAPPLETRTIVFTFDAETNLVTATAHADTRTAFGGLVGVFGPTHGPGISTVRLAVYGEAMGSDPRRLEIILSLDNTGSMLETGDGGSVRFDLMRSAAKNFVNTLFDNQTNPDKLFIGVVPWTTTVNINMQQPEDDYVPAAYAAPDVVSDGTREVPPAAFQDMRQYLKFPVGTTITGTGGSNSGHSTLLSNPPANSPAWTTLPGVNLNTANASHLAAFNALFAPVSWRGCIRSATNERQMSSPNSSTSLVSVALTDTPPNPMRWQVDAVEPLLKTWTSGTNSGRLACASVNNAADTYNSYISGAEGTTRPCKTSTSSGTNSTTAPCIADAYEFAWIAAHPTNTFCAFKTISIPRTDYDNPWLSGPNVNCPTAMLGLSGSREQVLRKLNMMYANSDGTHADIGLMWGLRMLSPNASWKTFFGHTGDNAPAAYNTDDTRKILILLTDGSNVAPLNWEGYYGCTVARDGTSNSLARSGAGRAADSPALPAGAHGCWTDGAVSNTPGNLTSSKLNSLTQDACNAIRNTYHIELFTIGVDIGTTSSAATVLRNCVNNDDSRASIITAAEIDETFMAIANETLRLTR